MDKGLFVTFEGPEGAGKTTQLEMLRKYFEDSELPCIVTREPGGTPMAEQFRQLVKHHDGNEPIFDETELLLFAASRAQHVRYIIYPALQCGTSVLCDRFHDSTTAYQGYGRNINLDFVKVLNRFAVGECVPDLTILLDLPPDSGLKRVSSREAKNGYDRLEQEDMSFHRAVRNGFLKIAEREPERVKIVNALASAKDIHRVVVRLIEDVVEKIC